MPPSIELEGCEVIFPHSVFFGDDGKPAFICQTDKDGKLMSVSQQNKLGLQEIRQKFSLLVRERKTETTSFVHKLKGKIVDETQQQNVS